MSDVVNIKEAARRKGKVTVLAVDDTAQNLELLEAILVARGYDVIKAYNGKDALNKVNEFVPDIILMDVLMPLMDGFEACRRLKAKKETALVPIILLTALDSLEDKVKGLDAGADDFITKPFNASELIARVKSFVRMKALVDELESAQNVLFSLASALDFTDPYTHGHSQRVADYSVKLAEYIGLQEDEVDVIRKAGLLHDIGKIGTDKIVLHKAGVLSVNEYAHVKDHPVVGESICKPLKFAQPLLPIIRGHHEKFNGTGYPDGLKGEEIAVGARIMAISDVYDALTSVRPYRNDIPSEIAIEVMKAEAVKGYWDPNLLKAFDGMLKSGFAQVKAASE